MGDEYDVIFLTNAQLAFTCHWVEGRNIAFNHFLAYFWFSSCFQFFPKMRGEGCGIFRILFFHTCFMFIMSFLKFTCQSYVSLFPLILFLTVAWQITSSWLQAPGMGQSFFILQLYVGGFLFYFYLHFFKNLGNMSVNSSPHIREGPVANLPCCSINN